MKKIVILLVVTLFVVGCADGDDGKDGIVGPSGMDKLMKSHVNKAKHAAAIQGSADLVQTLKAAEGLVRSTGNVLMAARIHASKTNANQVAKDGVAPAKLSYDEAVIARDEAKWAVGN